MAKALIFGVNVNGVSLPLRVNPVVILTGVSDAALDAVSQAFTVDADAGTLEGAAEGGGAGALHLLEVEVNGPVEIGDILVPVSVASTYEVQP